MLLHLKKGKFSKSEAKAEIRYFHTDARDLNNLLLKFKTGARKTIKRYLSTILTCEIVGIKQYIDTLLKILKKG